MFRGPVRPLACASALASLLACRVGPCPEATRPTSPPVVMPPPVVAAPLDEPPAPVEACTLTQAEAGARATAALASLAGTAVDAPPPGFAARRPCESHCLPNRSKPTDDVACGAWECPYVYGPPGLDGVRAASVTVHVLRCGAQVLTTERLADCFGKPHRCRLIVDRTAARALAEPRGALDWFEPMLRWVPAAGEFHWIAGFEDGPTLRISAHEPRKTWEGPVPVMPPYSDGSRSIAP